MKHRQMRRSLAVFLLCAMLLTSILPFAISAEGEQTGGDSATTEELYGGRTMEEILELISGSTYNAYVDKNSDKTVSTVKRKDPIVLDHTNIVGKDSPDFIDDKTGKDRTTADYLVKTTEELKIDKLKDANGKVVEGAQVVYTPNTGKVTYKVEITKEQAGMFAIDLLYYPIVNLPQDDGSNKVVSTKTTIERMFMLDGELAFNECRYLYIPRCWEYVGTDGTSSLYRGGNGAPSREDYKTEEEFQVAYDEWYYSAEYEEWLKSGGAGNFQWDKDIQHNDIRPDRLEAPEWRTYFLRDWLGYTVEPFQFYLSEGTHYLTFEATREPIVIGQVVLYGYEQEISYEQQLDYWLAMVPIRNKLAKLAATSSFRPLWRTR